MLSLMEVEGMPIVEIGEGSGTIAGDIDWFQFVSPVSGKLAIRQFAAPGSFLDSLLEVRDGD